MIAHSLTIFMCIVSSGLATSAASHDSISSHHLTVNAAHEWGSSSAGGAWSGFILGPIVFFCSFVCIWYN